MEIHMSRIVDARDTVTDTITASSKSYDPALTSPSFIRVFVDTLAHVVVARTGGAATTSDMPIPANSSEFIRVNPDELVYFIGTTGNIYFSKQAGM